ncbi:hypothetical protein [Candidatus Regiella endosymbiont of Tuberolachnus salignus]|uniref:hypothetical protein n=1 Tax=Candidatus Regiella endosymbiont of Tuberolachnus salignus TaxID=3077956 RepID=UPI0030CC6F43
MKIMSHNPSDLLANKKEQLPIVPKEEKKLDFKQILIKQMASPDISALMGDNNGGGNQTSMVSQMMVMTGMNNITEILNEQTELLKNISAFSDEKNNKSIAV